MILTRYLFIAILLLFAVAFAVAPLIAAALFAPLKRSRFKQQTYECGVVTHGETWIRFRIQYYIFALLFVVFDIETVFLYPWAAAYLGLGWFALIEMVVFLALLAAGLAYAWASGALKWV
jgi:NADH-quinone oxidoreductase subunit A